MQNLTFNAQNEVIDATEKGKNDLKILAQNYQFSESFILENADFLDWNIISENQKLTIEIIMKYGKKIKWKNAVNNPNIHQDAVLLAKKYKGNFFKMLQQEIFDEDFALKYMDFFEGFIEEFHEKLDWKYAFGYRKLVTFFKKMGSTKIYKDSYYF